MFECIRISINLVFSSIRNPPGCVTDFGEVAVLDLGAWIAAPSLPTGLCWLILSSKSHVWSWHCAGVVNGPCLGWIFQNRGVKAREFESRQCHFLRTADCLMLLQYMSNHASRQRKPTVVIYCHTLRESPPEKVFSAIFSMWMDQFLQINGYKEVVCSHRDTHF